MRFDKYYLRRLMVAVVVLTTSMPAWTFGQDAAARKPESGTAPKGLRIFVCGHSFHWYLPAPLGELAVADGIQDHKLVGQQSLGGSRTLQHWNLADDRNQAKQALMIGDVDVFTMSPIQFPDVGVENFVRLGLEHNPNMRFTVQLSWAAWDQDMQTFPRNATNTIDREKSPDELKVLNAANIKAGEEQIDMLNKKLGKTVVFLVPTAQAHIALRTKIYRQEIPGLTTQAELFRDPIGHPTAPVQALNAYLHYAVIYGRSPVGLAMPSVLKDTAHPEWDDKLNRTLQELAWETVTNYPPSGVTATPLEKK